MHQVFGILVLSVYISDRTTSINHSQSMKQLFTYLAICSLLFVLACEKEEDPQALPIANFEVVIRDSLTSSRVVLINKSENGDTYFWDFGDGNTSTAEAPSHFYNNSGIYTIRLVVKNSVGVSRIAKTAQIVGPPESAFDFLNAGCNADCDISFINQSKNATSYKWDFGDGNTSRTMNPIHTYKKAGLYTVRLVAMSATGADEQSRSLRINNAKQLPLAKFKVINNECKGPCEILFENQSENAATFEWDFGDGNSTSKPSPTYKYAKSGVYTVSLAAFSEDGTVSRTSRTISIK